MARGGADKRSATTSTLGSAARRKAGLARPIEPHEPPHKPAPLTQPFSGQRAVTFVPPQHPARVPQPPALIAAAPRLRAFGAARVAAGGVSERLVVVRPKPETGTVVARVVRAAPQPHELNAITAPRPEPAV